MKRWNIIALAIFIALTVVVLMLNPRLGQKIQGTFLAMITPFLKSGSELEKKISAVRTGLKSLEELEKENADLLVENKKLRATNQLLAEVQTENAQLRKSLDFRERSTFNLVPARVVARDASAWWNSILIDRGSNDGIRPEMPVVTDQGLVGKTTTVDDNVCRVVLISDENCKVAVVVEGSPDKGILWSVTGTRVSDPTIPELTIRFLPKTASLKPGQKVYSSGLGGIFPSGLLVGEVSDFTVRELDAQAKVQSKIDLATIEDVFVIVNQTEEDIEEAPAAQPVTPQPAASPRPKPTEIPVARPVRPSRTN